MMIDVSFFNPMKTDSETKIKPLIVYIPDV